MCVCFVGLYLKLKIIFYYHDDFFLHTTFSDPFTSWWKGLKLTYLWVHTLGSQVIMLCSHLLLSGWPWSCPHLSAPGLGIISPLQPSLLLSLHCGCVSILHSALLCLSASFSCLLMLPAPIHAFLPCPPLPFPFYFVSLESVKSSSPLPLIRLKCFGTSRVFCTRFDKIKDAHACLLTFPVNMWHNNNIKPCTCLVYFSHWVPASVNNSST